MPNTSVKTRNILTVSKLNRLARSILESEIGRVWLSGEISNFVAASSGHWYFSLKDTNAQIRAAMFRGANNKVLKHPKEGDNVLVKANLSLYEPRGDYQLIVEHLEPEGEGALKRAFEQLKIKLSAEGLFTQAHKQSLPDTVQRVGIISSPTGAALQDILKVLDRRNPGIEIIVYPTQVQGVQAAEQLCEALVKANQRDEVDVLILGRGGGSIEDLYCFNDEALARAIFASKLPIISAVGHEIDVTISDFVADLRAPTPSAAAEIVSEDQQSLLQQLYQHKARLAQHISTQLKYHQQRHHHLQQRLNIQHPDKCLQQQNQQLDRLKLSLQQALQQQLEQQKSRLQQLSLQLQSHTPSHRLTHSKQQLHNLQQRLQKSVQRLLHNKQQQLVNNSQLLNTVSPLATMARGYSISFKNDKLVRSAHELKHGDILTTRFADDEVQSQVLPKQEKLF